MNNEHEDVLPVPGVASKKVPPVITTEAFSGEPTTILLGRMDRPLQKCSSWDNETRLLWLEVCMTGKAQSAWRRLTPEVKAQYETAKAVLQKRFELESKRELYAVEFQTTLYSNSLCQNRLSKVFFLLQINCTMELTAK